MQPYRPDLSPPWPSQSRTQGAGKMEAAAISNRPRPGPGAAGARPAQGPFEQASHEFHVPLRNRRLLLHKKEIRKLAALTDQRGATIVPLRFYWKNGRVKVELGVGKGKDQHDKREDLKQRVHNREVEREMARLHK